MKYSLPVLKLYLANFGNQNIREDGDAILAKATAVSLDPQKFSKKAAQEGFPWATWLGLELLSGFAEGSERRSVFVYYRLLQGVIETYVLVQPIENVGPCYALVKNLTDTQREGTLHSQIIRPLALWDGPNQTAYRVFPPPSQTKKRRGTLLHVDHGNQAAFLSSYVDSIWPGIWKNNLLEYTDYELVPQEKETLAALEDKRINYRNVFVVLEPSFVDCPS